MSHPYESFMREAVELAERGRWSAAPNPTVGAVLVRDGVVVGRGWHTAYGKSHAEVECLKDAEAKGVDPSACTLVVTLELQPSRANPALHGSGDRGGHPHPDDGAGGQRPRGDAPGTGQRHRPRGRPAGRGHQPRLAAEAQHRPALLAGGIKPDRPSYCMDKTKGEGAVYALWRGRAEPSAALSGRSGPFCGSDHHGPQCCAGAGGGHRRACPGGADGALPEPKGRLRRGTGGGRIHDRSRP